MHTNPEVLALLALGEHSAASRSDREHIAGCDVCTAEVDELAHLAGVGRSVDNQVRIESPSPEVWRRIATELGLKESGPITEDRPTEHPASAPTPITAAPSSRGSRGRRILALAVAAVLALVVGVGAGIAYERLREPAGTVVAQTPLEALPAWAGASGEATLERDRDGNQILVVQVSNAREVTGSEQVWLIDRNVKGMVNLGLLVGDEGRFLLDADLDVSEFPIVDVSAEPNDGVVTHSGDSIVRGTLDV